MTELNAKIHKAPKEVTIVVNLEYTPEYYVRRWIAMQLIKIAATVLGCGIRVEQ